jgi:hypothetical protein
MPLVDLLDDNVPAGDVEQLAHRVAKRVEERVAGFAARNRRREQIETNRHGARHGAQQLHKERRNRADTEDADASRHSG